MDQTPGEWLRDARTSRGLTLRDVAEGVKCSPTYINKIELNQQTRPKPETLRLIARTIRRSEDEILAVFGYMPDVRIELGDPEMLRVKRILDALAPERRRRAVDAFETLVGV